MDANEKKLVQLRTKLEFYQKLGKKTEKVLTTELELEDWAQEVHIKKDQLEKQLESHKLEMSLPDSEWYEDEKPY